MNLVIRLPVPVVLYLVFDLAAEFTLRHHTLVGIELVIEFFIRFSFSPSNRSWWFRCWNTDLQRLHLLSAQVADDPFFSFHQRHRWVCSKGIAGFFHPVLAEAFRKIFYQQGIIFFRSIFCRVAIRIGCSEDHVQYISLLNPPAPGLSYYHSVLQAGDLVVDHLICHCYHIAGDFALPRSGNWNAGFIPISKMESIIQRIVYIQLLKSQIPSAAAGQRCPAFHLQVADQFTVHWFQYFIRKQWVAITSFDQSGGTMPFRKPGIFALLYSFNAFSKLREVIGFLQFPVIFSWSWPMFSLVIVAIYWVLKIDHWAFTKTGIEILF